ncbi:uncharacterized protein CTRU02_200198 [Colletotrichum truncatum]|uniref:Uncharacterized protein n=1 Tax=Colletotrichum truncatum TaxID=5467 RepID=A0ACC3ZDW7_COLTU|nr:uncharacterized protein CTRU02_05077 [Colletotrichum truncatum]KAF6794876.1 hypothetical protein CTRU02_05077 [Colletotrichum truncatum]
MKVFAGLPLLCGMLFAAVSSQDVSLNLARRDSWDEFIAFMAEEGQCINYIDPSPNDGLEPCRIWCKAKGQPEDSVGCHSSHIPVPDGSYPTDRDGYKWQPGDCFCAEEIEPIAEAFITPVLEALSKLDEVICAVFTQAVVNSIEIGFALVPGVGQAATAARQATKLAVEGAKSFAENGLGPAAYFDDWVSKSCGLDKIDLAYDDTFNALVGAPDSVGTSVGCKQKNKKACKKLDPRPDPPQTKKEDGPTPTQDREVPASTKQPEATTTADPQTTTTTTSSTSTTTSSDSPGQTAVNCQLCSSPKLKREAREARWGSMFEARAAGDTCILDKSNGKGGQACPASNAVVKVRDGILQDRALTEDNPVVKVNGEELVIECGKHKPCADARTDSKIDKYYYLEQDAKCGGDFAVGSSAQVEGLKFQNDHVYEKQTLALFFEWLGNGDGVQIGSTLKPGPAWVAEVLLKTDSNRIFLLQPSDRAALGIPNGGASVDDVMAYGIARSDPVAARGGMSIDKTTRNFALVQDKVNENKGTFFKGSQPSPLDIEAGRKVNKDRNWIRTHAGVFQYLNYVPPNGKERIWNKWMRVSNWIDLVLHEFDLSYPWGSHADEPRRVDGANPSLRSLYSYWIDTYLGDIEFKAGTWATAAREAFRLNYGAGEANAEKEWVRKAFGANGFATAERMVFPRPENSPPHMSAYGAYGNPAMTFDAAGNAVANLPVKAAL